MTVQIVIVVLTLDNDHPKWHQQGKNTLNKCFFFLLLYNYKYIILLFLIKTCSGTPARLQRMVATNGCNLQLIGRQKNPS